MSVGKPPVVENQSTTFTCCVPARVDANHSIASRTPKMRKWKKRHIPRIIDYPDLHLRPGLADPRTVLCAHDILSRAQKYIKLSLHDIVGHHHPQAYGGAFVTQSMWPYRTYVRQKQGTGDQLVRSSEAQAACSRSFVTPHSFRGAIFWKRAAFPANYDLPVSNKAAQCMQHIGSWLSRIFCNFPRRMPSRMALEPFKDFSLSHFYYLACGKLFRQASPRAHTKSSCVPGRIAPYVSFPLSSSTSMSKSSISSAS